MKARLDNQVFMHTVLPIRPRDMHVTRRRASRAARRGVFNLDNLTLSQQQYLVAMAHPEEDHRLFDQCRVSIVRSKDLPLETAEQVRFDPAERAARNSSIVPIQLAAVIEEYGGEPLIHENTPEKNDTIESTHIVSNTINFLTYDLACNALIPVVKPSWVHTSLAKRKIANPRQHSPDPRLFLNDVVVTCGDIPEGDKDAIIGGVLAKGGLYSPRVTGMVTHLVDLTAESDKGRLVQAKKMRVKIVLPHWYVTPVDYHCGLH